MSATLIGTTGEWGMDETETGLIVESLDYDYSDKEKEVMNKGGSPIGIATYAEVIACQLKGLIPTATPFSGALSGTLALSNTITDHLAGSVSSGRNIIRTIKKSVQIEDFQRLDIGSKFYPLIAA